MENTNMSREIFSISAIKDRNKDFIWRINSTLLNKIEKELDLDSEIDVILELHSNINIKDYDKYYDIIKHEIQEMDLQKRNIDLFLNNISYIWTTSINNIRKILLNTKLNFISFISLKNSYSASRSVWAYKD